ncbi:MAG: DUF2486 family protein [Thiotrichaceae bacterium]|nr:DUF2486 family protein [Thiotrichaceae bacterium]
MTKLNSDQHIPVLTDVVVLGNPELKKKAADKMIPSQHASLNFQKRIDEVESAIGQDEMRSPSRAHAIRAEALL